MVILFEVVDDVEVSFRNKRGTFSNIEKDDKVTVTVDRINRVIRVEVDRRI